MTGTGPNIDQYDCVFYELSGGKKPYWKSIVVFNVDKKEWEEFGKMREARGLHAISTVQVKDILDHC